MKYLIALALAVLVGCSPSQPTVDTKMIPLTEEELAYIVSHPVVTWAAEDNRPPYVLLDSGVYKGTTVEFFEVISKKTGLKFKAIRTITFSDSLAAMETGKVDIMPAIRPTPTRAETMGFSPPFTYNGGVFMFRANALPRSPLTVGLRKGEAAKEYLEMRFPDMKIVETDDDEQAMGLLEKGLLDGVVMDDGSASYWISKSNVGVRKAVINFDYPYSFAYSKDNHLLGQILTKAVNSITVQEKKTLNGKL